MSKSVFDEIPQGFTIDLLGPILGFWSCELSNEDFSIKIKSYGDSAEESVQTCLKKLKRKSKQASKFAQLMSRESESTIQQHT